MKGKFVDWACWILTFLPLFVTGIVYPFFPDIIPAHWNGAGQINRYGSKIELFIFPVLILVLVLFSKWFSSWINKGFKDAKQIGAVTQLSFVAVLNITAYSVLFNTYAEGHSKAAVDLPKIILIMFGFFNIVLAYYLPKSRQNSRIGIRTKWTLRSEDIWHKTHRLGGWLLTLGGLVSIIASLLMSGFMCIYMMLIIEIVILGILVVYSLYVYMKLKKV